VIARWSALIAAASLFLGLGMLGDTPDTRDSSDQVAQYFVDHSSSVLTAVVLLGITAVALVVFATSLPSRLTQSATTVVVTVMLTALALPYAALAYVVGAEAPESAKALFELTLVATPIIALPLALLMGSVASATRRDHPRFAVASLACVVVLVVAAASFAQHGVLSPDVQQQVVFQSFIAWLVACAIVLGRRQPMNTARSAASASTARIVARPSGRNGSMSTPPFDDRHVPAT
jgi:hypothetical protein